MHEWKVSHIDASDTKNAADRLNALEKDDWDILGITSGTRQQGMSPTAVPVVVFAHRYIREATQDSPKLADMLDVMHNAANRSRVDPNSTGSEAMKRDRDRADGSEATSAEAGAMKAHDVQSGNETKKANDETISDGMQESSQA